MKKYLSDSYITEDGALSRVIELIENSKLVALDTEFTRERTYYPILSLIQIAVKDKNSDEVKFFIIDCLSGLDLQPFWHVVADKKIAKILHSSLQDLQIFHQKSGALPQNVIDTQMMANFCGFGFNIGYSGLVNILFNKELDKKLQRSDWQRRPLSQLQLEYAILDVAYLENITEGLMNRLENMGRKSWYEEEMTSFIEKTLFPEDENLFKNFIFLRKTPKQIAQIKSLVLWREDQAKKRDIPRQHFIKDEAIMKIVMTNGEDLKLKNIDLDEVKKILDGAEESDEKRKNIFMSERQKENYKEAKKLMSKVAVEENIKEQFLITSNLLKNIVCEKDLIDKMLSGWRYQLFGEKLKKIIT